MAPFYDSSSSVDQTIYTAEIPPAPTASTPLKVKKTTGTLEVGVSPKYYYFEHDDDVQRDPARICHTISMPEDILARWLEALRSGRYQQGRKALRSEDGYCCLGVLVHVVDTSSPLLLYKQSLPSLEWLAKHGIVFYDAVGRGGRQSPGLFDERGLGRCATVWNDTTDVGFKGIADMIERQAVVTRPSRHYGMEPLRSPVMRRQPEYVQHFNPEGWKK
jgi:hypothetical protein